MRLQWVHAADVVTKLMGGPGQTSRTTFYDFEMAN